MDPVVAKIAEQFRVVHGHLRDEVRELSVEELNWKPAPDTNSIAVLVVHTPVPRRRCSRRRECTRRARPACRVSRNGDRRRRSVA